LARHRDSVVSRVGASLAAAGCRGRGSRKNRANLVGVGGGWGSGSSTRRRGVLEITRSFIGGCDEDEIKGNG
jgi:hypothetical protein